MKNSQISFKSAIYLTSEDKIKKKMGPLMVRPVGLRDREIVNGSKVAVMRIATCTAGGIITQGENNVKEVTMFHFDPDWLENLDYNLMKKHFNENLAGKKPIQALIFGSKDGFEGFSIEVFNKVEKFIRSLKIPYSKFEGLPSDDISHGYYDATKDKWTLCITDRHNDIDTGFLNKKNVFSALKKVKISSIDHLV